MQCSIGKKPHHWKESLSYEDFWHRSARWRAQCWLRESPVRGWAEKHVEFVCTVTERSGEFISLLFPIKQRETWREFLSLSLSVSEFNCYTGALICPAGAETHHLEYSTPFYTPSHCLLCKQITIPLRPWDRAGAHLLRKGVAQSPANCTTFTTFIKGRGRGMGGVISSLKTD